jgi:ribose transport system ATP-binding protein
MRREVFRACDVIYRNKDVTLLDRFNMHIFEGEVFGLFFTDNHGENELVRLTMEGGAIDFGSISLRDERVNSFLMPMTARVAGVSLISRDEGLLDEMTVAENVFVMRKNFHKYVINSGVVLSQFERLAAEYDVVIDGNAFVRDLAPVDRFIVRLLKAAVEGSFLIIIKNPGLSPDGPAIESFHRHVRRFAMSSHSFLYTSRDVSELFRICDRIGVVERGRIVNTIKREDFDEKQFRRYYFYPDQMRTAAETYKHTVLSFRAALKAGLSPIELDVSEGECVLLWDKSDMAITQMVRILSGEIGAPGGHILIDGRKLASYGDKAPVSIIREAPDKNGIFGDMSYLDNLCFKAANRFPALWRKASVKQSIRNEYLPLAGNDVDALAPLSLSQESAYTLIYLREHIYRPRLLVLVRPFLDTNIRLKMHILSLIEMLRAAGASLLILDNAVSESSAIANRTVAIKDSQINIENREAAS